MCLPKDLKTLPQLVRGFCTGKDDDIDEFIRYFHPTVHKVVCNLLPSGYDTEQVEIDVFFKLWQHRHKLPADASVLYFVLAVTKRCAIDAYRKEKRHSTCSSLSETPDTIQDCAHSEPGAWIEITDFLKVLKPELRNMLMDYYLRGFTARELASAYKIHLPTVYTRLHRARKILQAHYAEEAKNYE